MSNKELIEKIKTECLGKPLYGFEDETLWHDFIESHFTRSGEIDGEKYSSKLNRTLSYAALSQTLNKIRKYLDALDV